MNDTESDVSMESVDAVTYEDEDGRTIRRSWDDGEVVEEVVDRV